MADVCRYILLRQKDVSTLSSMTQHITAAMIVERKKLNGLDFNGEKLNFKMALDKLVDIESL